MYSEIGFLFSPGLEISNRNNEGDIYNRTQKIRPRKKNTSDANFNTGTKTFEVIAGSQTNQDTQEDNLDDAILVYKSPYAYGTDRIKNYIKNNVYRNDESNEDPYISLINYFNTQQTKALRLKAADFAYLKDLGVYPINRLWILRRFPDNAIVPNNLLSWGKAVEPISTIVGWIKPKDDGDFLSLSFNEVWTDQTETLDKVIGSVLKDMGLSGPDKILSVPGWSQGLLWGMLNSMGLTDAYDYDTVPSGDPNVLRRAKMREYLSQGLESDIKMTLETCYEQKYINGIDPGMAMMDIMSNLFKMGTSEQKFMLGNSPALQKFIGATNASSKEGKDNFIAFIQAMISAFVNGVTKFINEMATYSGDGGGDAEQGEGEPKEVNQDQKNKGNDSDGSGGGGGFFAPLTSMGGVIGGIGSTANNVINNLAATYLAGTVYKMRWPLKSSIALMCGINSTPWHLTIGNPYSPIINIGNIHVRNVDAKLSDELGFNDMPARIMVGVDASLGRPLGRSELERMFNNGYKRVYAKSSLNVSEPTNNSSVSGINANVGQSLNPSQPVEVRSTYDKSASPTWPPAENSGYGTGFNFGGK